MGAIILDAGAEVAADGARHSFGGIGSAHGIAPARDGSRSFEHHDHDFAGAHEGSELAKKSLPTMNRVKAFGLEWSEAQGFHGYDRKAGAMDARENVAGEAAADGVWLDDGERAFELGFGQGMLLVFQYPVFFLMGL